MDKSFKILGINFLVLYIISIIFAVYLSISGLKNVTILTFFTDDALHICRKCLLERILFLFVPPILILPFVKLIIKFFKSSIGNIKKAIISSILLYLVIIISVLICTKYSFASWEWTWAMPYYIVGFMCPVILLSILATPKKYICYKKPIAIFLAFSTFWAYFPFLLLIVYASLW